MNMLREKVIKSLRTNYIVAFISTLIIIVAFESNHLYKGALAHLLSGEQIYIIQTAAVMLTIILVPLALKTFSNAMSKASKKGEQEVIGKFSKMGLLRIALLFAAIVFNIFTYYGINYEGAMYCGIIAYGALIYSYPTKATLEQYLNNNEA